MQRCGAAVTQCHFCAVVLSNHEATSPPCHEATSPRCCQNLKTCVAADAAPSSLTNVHTHHDSLANKPLQSYRLAVPCRPRDLDLLTSAERMSTKFGVDSSSRFHFTARTDRHKITDTTDNPIPTHGRSQ